ncbi:YraN family protein [Porphyromonas sp. COT-290 OH860]|uniref:YraN family protein n=1 Tax=Porphyromonas sp. COT-290 OH860 TaxID=1515615 RepID=UPI0005C56D3B|nr:YraN family protein [Porphyromonas sp. COT-290 OH860]
MESHLAKGRIGEEIACRLLEEAGLRILERNWRHRHSEVDIIAQEGDELVFVEVKVRSLSAYQTATEAVDADKQGHLIKAANAYIRLYQCTLSVRYDIIAIDLAEDNRYRLEHIRSAYYPMLRGKRPSSRQSRQ